MEPSELIGQFLEFLEKEHGVSSSDLKSVFTSKDDEHHRETAKAAALVPIDAFSEELGAFETVVKFLREAYEFKHGHIAELVERSEATIRGTYRNALKKQPTVFTLEGVNADELSSNISFPASRLSDRRLSVFEHIVLHLLEQGLTLKDIARALNRDSRTVWTIKSRAKKKLGGGHHA